ncbi:MAG: hypothetical protein QXX41_00265 [Nitrososphaerota archaeon]
MPKAEKEMSEMIVFKAPRELRRKLEEYCQNNGLSLSYAVRKAVEDQILTPKFTWEDFMAWKDWVQNSIINILQKITATEKELMDSNERILKFLKSIIEEHPKNRKRLG